MKTFYSKIGRNVKEVWVIGNRTYRLTAEVWTEGDDLAVQRWQVAQRQRDLRHREREGLKRLLAAVMAEGAK